MRLTNPFLVVEFPTQGLALPEATRQHPGSTVDLVMQSKEGVGGHTVYRSVMRVAGFTERAFVDLLSRLRTLYGEGIEVLRAEPDERVWIVRTEIQRQAIHSPELHYLMRFEEAFGTPYGHIEGGVYHVRAQARDPEAAEADAQRIRAWFAKAGLEAQVSVEGLSERELELMTELRRH